MIEWNDSSYKTKKGNQWNNNNFEMHVTEVSTEPYTGQVYNLEVADCHSYIATGYAVHNCFIGVDETYTEPYAIILNSWSDVHGHLKDFQTGDQLPVGVLRVRRADAEKHIAAAETFAYSQFDGFPEQGLDKALFMLI